MQIAFAAGAGFFGTVAFVAAGDSLPNFAAFIPGTSASSSSTSAECRIKGNISIETGERIYHVPGQTYYQQTRISPQHGERWFCSEDEARAAGWRKSRR